jgi:hypothetical protein
MTTTTLRHLAAAVVCLFSASAFAAQITTTHSSTKVRPQAAPPPNVPVELVAARNESVAFQVVVAADTGSLEGVRASFNGLRGAGSSIDAGNVLLYREDYLDLTQVSFPTSETGRWPDPLVPDKDETFGEQRNAFPFSVPQGESRVLWVDVLVPQDANPGRYEGSVLVQGSGLEQSVPIKLTVLPTELPSTSSIASAFLFHREKACQAHTGVKMCGSDDRWYELASKYQRLALEHRITLSNTLTYPKDGDWDTYDTRYGPWLDGTAPSRLPGAKITSAQFTGTRDNAAFGAFEGHMKERGWIDRAYDYTGDEPPYGISFSDAQARLQAVKAAAPELRTLLTTTVTAADAHNLSPYLDLMVPVINYMDGVEKGYVGDQRALYDSFLSKSGKALWLYQSCMSHGCAFGTNEVAKGEPARWPSYMVDTSGARNRAMQWVVFLENASGELYYETALQLPNAWSSVFAFGGNGDGTLFYPGLPNRIGGSTDVPLPSMRLKQIRQGMQDYEWLKKVADAGDPEFARRTARELIPTAHQVIDDGAAFEAARLRLIGQWLKLTGHASDSSVSELTHCIPSDEANGTNRCPNAFLGETAALGSVSCTSSMGVPSALALLGAVALVARRRKPAPAAC